MSTETSVTRRYLVRRPKALQFFHNGHLKKASDEERQAGRFELFLDLLCKFVKVRTIGFSLLTL
jgi:hypothetical protein